MVIEIDPLYAAKRSVPQKSQKVLLHSRRRSTQCGKRERGIVRQRVNCLLSDKPFAAINRHGLDDARFAAEQMRNRITIKNNFQECSPICNQLNDLASEPIALGVRG